VGTDLCIDRQQADLKDVIMLTFIFLYINSIQNSIY